MIEEYKYLIRMIISIITYAKASIHMPNVLLDEVLNDKYIKKYIDIFGIEITTQTIKEVIKNTQEIRYNTYTDSEGLSYNAYIPIDYNSPYYKD